jgi:hypothetical protein
MNTGVDYDDEQEEVEAEDSLTAFTKILKSMGIEKFFIIYFLNLTYFSFSSHSIFFFFQIQSSSSRSSK